MIGPLDRLAERGVRLIVCGQTMVGRNPPRVGFLPFVLVSRATTVAQARLAAEGLTLNPFLRRGRTQGVLSGPSMGSESMTSSACHDVRARNRTVHGGTSSLLRA